MLNCAGQVNHDGHGAPGGSGTVRRSHAIEHIVFVAYAVPNTGGITWKYGSDIEFLYLRQNTFRRFTGCKGRFPAGLFRQLWCIICTPVCIFKIVCNIEAHFHVLMVCNVAAAAHAAPAAQPAVPLQHCWPQSLASPQKMNGSPDGTCTRYSPYARPKNFISCCSSTGTRRLKNVHTCTQINQLLPRPTPACCAVERC